MKLLINSQPQHFTGKHLSELVQNLNMPTTHGIALAVNEKVVPKSEWGNFQLNENDKVLIIKATQGG
jgi:sulfur carrier protein